MAGGGTEELCRWIADRAAWPNTTLRFHGAETGALEKTYDFIGRVGPYGRRKGREFTDYGTRPGWNAIREMIRADRGLPLEEDS